MKTPYVPHVEGNDQGRRDFEDTTPDFPSSGAVIPWLFGAIALVGACIGVALLISNSIAVR